MNMTTDQEKPQKDTLDVTCLLCLRVFRQELILTSREMLVNHLTSMFIKTFGPLTGFIPG